MIRNTLATDTDAFIVAHGLNRPEILVETLEKQPRSQKDAGLPGYASMKLAVIRARIAESFEPNIALSFFLLWYQEKLK